MTLRDSFVEVIRTRRLHRVVLVSSCGITALLMPALFGLSGTQLADYFDFNAGSFLYFTDCINGSCATIGINTIGQLVPLVIAILSSIGIGIQLYRKKIRFTKSEVAGYFLLSLGILIGFILFQEVTPDGISKSTILAVVSWTVLTAGTAMMFRGKRFFTCNIEIGMGYLAQTFAVFSAFVMIYMMADLAGLQQFVLLGSKIAYVGGGGVADGNFSAPVSMLLGYPACKILWDLTTSIWRVQNVV